MPRDLYAAARTSGLGVALPDVSVAAITAARGFAVARQPRDSVDLVRRSPDQPVTSTTSGAVRRRPLPEASA